MEFRPSDERASMDGPVSANMSYSDWLKTQDDDVVRDILGPTRFEMWKDGAEVSAFVIDGRELKIGQLMYLEGIGKLIPGNNEVEHILDMQSKHGPSNTEPEHIDRSSDYSGVSYNKAREEEMEYLHKMTEQSGYKNEYFSIMDKKGNVLGTWKGDHTINIDALMRDILQKSPDGTLSLLHTHLDDKISFTRSDLRTLVKYKSIHDISIKYPNGSIDYISIGNKTRPSVEKFDEWLNKKSLDILDEKFYLNIKRVDDRWERFYLRRNYEIEKEYGWEIR